MSHFPTGVPLSDSSSAGSLSSEPLEGRIVRLEAPDARRDAEALFGATHGEGADPGQWTYMSYGPFADAAAMRRWIERVQGLEDPLSRVVREVRSAEPVGMVSFLNIVPDHRRLELGGIWYAPRAQRTLVNTETIYLMLRESFDRLRYRRVEWKCDALNARSKAAAVRLGFSFEGIFRQHVIVKGRNRDTAWFAMLDGDWPRIRANFEAVLHDPDCRESLSALNAGAVRARPPEGDVAP